MEYRQAREVTLLYAELSDAHRKIEKLQARILCLEAELSALLALSQDYLQMLQRARGGFWV
jgi:hypothetical protein